MTKPTVAIIGGGPTGLMAAEALSASDLQIDIYDAMPSLGRKFLMAGKSGLNLTHSEPLEAFLARFGAARTHLEPALQAFPPEAIREWANGLGIETFVGSSGRVFPNDFKAAPLLRAWLRRLRGCGVRIHARHKWTGWVQVNNDGKTPLSFDTPNGEVHHTTDAVILAMGGGSWTRLGSDAAWVPILRDAGIDITALRPANCGFNVNWSEHFKERFAGEPLKAVTLSFGEQIIRGECVISETGIESGAVYMLSAALRDHLDAHGEAILKLDLCPDRTPTAVLDALSRPRGKKTMATHLKRVLGISGVKSGLLHEFCDRTVFGEPVRLAEAIKSLGIPLVSTRPLDEAISSAGGVALTELDEGFMLCALPGVFCCGEMIDWEAPTGGYLLSACFALGHASGLAAADWLSQRP